MKESTKEDKLWTSDFVLIFISRTFISVVFTMLNVVIAAYAIQRFRVSIDLAGIAVGVFILSSILSRIIAGRYLDYVGRKKMLVITAVFLFIASCGYLVLPGIVGLLITRCIHGLAHGASSNTSAAFVTDIIPKSRLAEGLGYLSLSTTVASAIGPFLGITLLQSGQYIAMFIVCSLLSFIGMLLCFFVKDPYSKSGTLNPSTISSGVASLIDKNALPLSIIIFILCIASSCVTAFLSPYADQVDLTIVASWFFVVNAIGMAVSRLFLGRIQDKKGDNVIAFPLLIFFSVGLLVLCFPSTFTFIAAALLIAIGYGGLFPACQTMAVRDIPSERIGVATSTFFVFTDAGLGLGPMFGGLFIADIGYSGLYLCCAAIVALAAIPYWFLHGKKQK